MASSSSPAALLLVGLALAAVGPAATARAGDDLIQLLNGDLLHGSLVSADPATGVSWRHEHVKEPLVFAMDSLRQVKLKPRLRPAAQDKVSVVRLTNDDVLQGSLASLQDGKLQLATSYAGTISVHQPMVSSIALVPGTDVVFEGPSGAEQWDLTSPSSWHYKNNALYCTGSGYAGAHVGLPDAARIDFTVAWKGTYPYFRFAFYTANLRSYSSQSYSFRSSSSYLRMYRYGGRGSSSLPSHNHSGFAGKSRARFRIFADKKRKRVFIFLDDEKVVQWTEPQEWVGGGNSVTFYGYQSHPLKITDFVVSRWDGATLPDKATAPQKMKRDLLELVNGDKVTGTLSAIAGEKLSFKTSYASIEVPMQRVASIVMSGETAERARRNRNDVRIHLVGGGNITLSLKSLSERRIIGSGEGYGDVTVSLDSVAKLDFNIYDEQEGKAEDNW